MAHSQALLSAATGRLIVFLTTRRPAFWPGVMRLSGLAGRRASLVFGCSAR